MGEILNLITINVFFNHLTLPRKTPISKKPSDPFDEVFKFCLGGDPQMGKNIM